MRAIEARASSIGVMRRARLIAHSRHLEEQNRLSARPATNTRRTPARRLENMVTDLRAP
jgi:hypothetical protein